MGIMDWGKTPHGRFERKASVFRSRLGPDGPFPAEKGRYHLYVSYACPWAHRTLILRKLKGLEDFIDISVVHPHLLEGGWHFVAPEDADGPVAPQSEHSSKTFPDATTDPINGSKRLSDLYFKADGEYQGRFTVPVLWDKKEGTIVSNESSEIIRDLTHAFDDLLPEGEAKALDTYPVELREEIDALNEWVYDDINNGVYKSGFATKQEAYDAAVHKHVEAMDRIEKLLSDGREFLVGGRLTEADVRLFTTIIRYDPVYYVHFKTNWGSIRHDYPNLHRWVRNLYWNYPAFKDTTFFEHITEHYYYSHAQINPNRIVPYGPHPMIQPLDEDAKRQGEDISPEAKKAKV